MGNRTPKMNNDNNISYEYNGIIYDNFNIHIRFNGEIEKFNDIMNIKINNGKNYIIIKAQIYIDGAIRKIILNDSVQINDIMFPQEMAIQQKKINYI